MSTCGIDKRNGGYPPAVSLYSSRVNDKILLGEIDLSGRTSTGRTIHRRGGQTLPTPTRLELAQYRGDEGIYLLHYNGDVEQSDTYHDTLAEAIEQARFEFEIGASDWTFKKND